MDPRINASRRTDRSINQNKKRSKRSARLDLDFYLVRLVGQEPAAFGFAARQDFPAGLGPQPGQEAEFALAF